MTLTDPLPLRHPRHVEVGRTRNGQRLHNELDNQMDLIVINDDSW